MIPISVSRAKQHRFIRFHCFQGLFLFALLVPSVYSRARPATLVSLILIVGWVVATIQARKGKTFHFPLLGHLAGGLA